ncbi:hypothetical protein Tco_0939572 [Tanacetum coccineum]|uniref:Uncharacterized protein n=1 Tax=Tanacetum coccineum TaxID=301880 RepID=A0ABQ5DMU5_9ASTR
MLLSKQYITCPQAVSANRSPLGAFLFMLPSSNIVLRAFSSPYGVDVALSRPGKRAQSSCDDETFLYLRVYGRSTFPGAKPT